MSKPIIDGLMPFDIGGAMAYNKKSIKDIDVKNKKVLVRVDFNVPIVDEQITDLNRILGAMPTIEYLSAQGAKVILCSHLGKPKEYDQKFSLALVAKKLEELMGKKVAFAADKEVVGEQAKKIVAEMKSGDIFLLENTRFRKEETKNEESFSKELASLADVFVSDAFGSAHRAHCSTVGAGEFLSDRLCGFLIEKELDFLGNAIEHAKRPFTAILGGAKVSDKLGVIDNLLDKVDNLIIGGGMAYTFLKAQGYSIGNSLLEEEKISYAKEMIEKAKNKGVNLLLPEDFIIADHFAIDAEPTPTTDQNIADGFMGLDIGIKTREKFAQIIAESKTVVWNGPMGVFEFPNFAKGTFSVAEAMAANREAVTIIGGGDSAAAVNQLGFGSQMSHISTGGGASLEFLEGKVLPGIATLDDKEE